jgi:hypothetical protein
MCLRSHGHSEKLTAADKEKWESSGSPLLPAFFPSIEEADDRKMLSHFPVFSSVLSLSQGQDNPFQGR